MLAEKGWLYEDGSGGVTGSRREAIESYIGTLVRVVWLVWAEWCGLAKAHYMPVYSGRGQVVNKHNMKNLNSCTACITHMHSQS